MSPVHQNLVLQGYPLCVLSVPYCGWAMFAFSLVVCNGSLCLLSAGVSPCVVVNRPIWGHLGLDLGQTRCLTELWSYILKCRSFSQLYPLKDFCWWVRPAIRLDACPQPSAGASVKVVCMVILPSLQGKSHSEGPLATVGASCTCHACDSWMFSW